MNNILNKFILVVCLSDVVRTGLAEILKGCMANEIILLQRGDEIIDFPEITGNIVVISTRNEFEKSGELIKQILAGRCKLGFMTLQMEMDLAQDEPSLNLYDSPSLICYKVNELFNSFPANSGNETGPELTRREMEVLRLISKGFSNKEIADQLFVSTHTVISHRKNITEKTGIRSASGLTMYAILKKIIDVTEIDTSDLI